MAAWLKITKPNVEIGANFLMYQALIIDLELATGFAIQTAGSVSFIVDGKAFVVQKQFDEKAYQAVLNFAQRVTGQSLV
ncbi:MAG: hypothetical protein SGI73_09420 [Chloroflexota bacterium]|nr:hypothetical protein [Chloroflexota bacterium]